MLLFPYRFSAPLQLKNGLNRSQPVIKGSCSDLCAKHLVFYFQQKIKYCFSAATSNKINEAGPNQSGKFRIYSGNVSLIFGSGLKPGQFKTYVYNRV
ncbi:MAG TPA: hypothetical protein VK927_02405, partial [Adhaeribacter sp.]|nr:hypothetical protein [Adhaeribacter sp.]